MTFVREIPLIEGWLQEHAATWRCLTDVDYKSLMSRWKSTFGRLIEGSRPFRTGSRAMVALEGYFPASVFLFGGVRVPQVANMGGAGCARAGAWGYHATNLRNLDRDLANILELILVDDRFTYTCIFTHEAGAMVWEQLYISEGAA